MGLFSALFGGGKTEAKARPAKPVKAAPAKPAPAKPAKAEKVVAKAAETAADVLVLTPKGAAAPVAGVTELRLAYAAHDRAGAHDKAYATAAKLVAVYKACGAVALKKIYCAAAERHLLARLVQVSADKRAFVVAALRRRMDVAAARAAIGPEAAKLLAAHGAWLKAAGK